MSFGRYCRRLFSFFIGFNLILFTKRLILEDYLIQFTGFFMQLYRPLSSARWSLSLK